MKILGSFWFLFYINVSITILNTVSCVSSKSLAEPSIMDNFNNGLKLAGQMFGINTAADVANLVAKAFSTTSSRKQPDSYQKEYTSPPTLQDHESSAEQNQHQNQHFPYSINRPTHDEEVPRVPSAFKKPSEMTNTVNFVTNLLKVIGFDAEKLGALAINALIMVAQVIGNTLMHNTINRRDIPDTAETDNTYASPESESEELPQEAERQNGRIDNPIFWFLKNSNDRMRRTLLSDMTNNNLPDRLITVIEQLETRDGGEGGACLKMLMCKSSPFIWGMQKSLAGVLVNDTLHVGRHSRADDKNKDEKEAEKEQQEPNTFMNTKGFFRHLPSLKEFREHSTVCEQRYVNYCNITNQFYKN